MYNKIEVIELSENKNKSNNNLKREFPFFLSLIPFIVMVGLMYIAVTIFETDPHIPLIMGTVTASLIAFLYGKYDWEDVEDMMFTGIRLALPALVIILLIGLVIGSWIGGGIVATMIYYGLMLINPTYFLITISAICALTALAIGSSWSTMATIGVAGMGIGVSMGINPGIVAGAIISGSYFGDKLSPLSDTTNLASGLTNTDLFEHIKHMLFTTIPSFIIAMIAFTIIGFNVGDTSKSSQEDVQAMMASMQEHFIISPWLLLIPVIVVVAIMFKLAAFPALSLGVILGFLCHIFVQSGDVSVAFDTLTNGYSIESKNDMVNELFNRGGLHDMMYTISMTIVAMTFAGVMEFTGMLQSIMNKILFIAKGTFGLIAATLASAFTVNATCSEQYISIVVPSRMFLKTFIDRNLHSKNLSRTLEDGGTMTSVFIPWNTCGVFILATLGVPAWEYGMYAILNFTSPLIALLLAATGIGITKITDQEKEEFTAQYLKD